MNTRNLIKSVDLCDRCKFTHEPYCAVKSGGECTDCTNITEDAHCQCDTVAMNTPCQFFDEFESANK